MNSVTYYLSLYIMLPSLDHFQGSKETQRFGQRCSSTMRCSSQSTRQRTKKAEHMKTCLWNEGLTVPSTLFDVYKVFDHQ